MTNEIFNNPYIQYMISPAVLCIVVVYFLNYAINFGSFKERFKHIENDVADLKRDMKEVKDDITKMKIDVASLKSDMNSVKEDVSIIKKLLLSKFST